MLVSVVALAVLGHWTATPPTRYHLVERNGSWWFADQRGRTFFSFGVCCVDQGIAPKEFEPKNPGYCALRQYVSRDEWAKDTMGRLRTWGFDTIGAWSDHASLLPYANGEFHFTPILHMGASAGAPWRDLWDPKTVQAMDATARVQIVPLKGRREVVGYFSDNELGWWGGAIWEWAFRAGPKSRAHVVDMLSRLYGGSWPALNRDFEASGAQSFAQLRHSGRLYLRPGGSGMEAVKEWNRVLSDRYYSLCRSIIKRYDPGALYLGDRYISNFYPEIAESAGRYADVVSTNLNADWNDGDVARFFLPTLRARGKRPILISEYYACARQNRSLNRNSSSGFPVVATQAERAKVFERTTRTLINAPYVVGAHWFQYYDEPRNGRPDGENYDMGLVDIFGWPYEELTASASALTRAPRRPTVAGVSKLTPELTASQAYHLDRWPRGQAYVPPLGLCERGDLYVGWTPDSLWVAAYWNEDRFPESFYQGGKIPQIEQALLTVAVGTEKKGLRVRVGPCPSPSADSFLVVNSVGERNLAILRIPVAKVGRKRLRPGDTIDFGATLDTRGRAYRMRWNRKIVLSGTKRLSSL